MKKYPILLSLLLFSLCLPTGWLARAQEPQPAPGSVNEEQFVRTTFSPGFYSAFGLVTVQTPKLMYDFSSMDYRLTGYGLMLSPTSKFGGINVNLLRLWSFKDGVFQTDRQGILEWAEIGFNFPIIRRWEGSIGLFSRFALMLTVNTTLKNQAFMIKKARERFEEDEIITESYPQMYDFGLEYRKNMLWIKAGYIKQLRKFEPKRSEFANFPKDLSGPYFELGIGLAFWSRRKETIVLKGEKQIMEQAPPNINLKYEFTEPSGNMKLDGGESGILKLIIENKGKGYAKGVRVRLHNLSGKNPHLSFPTLLKVDDIEPKRQVKLDISISADRNLSNGIAEMEIMVDGKNFEFLSKEFSITLQEYDPTDEPVQTGMSQPDAVAVIIGIQNYQDPRVPAVRFAERDAQIMREYLVRTLGFHPSNILPKDPKVPLTAGQFKTLIRQVLPSYIKPGTSDVFFFYAGHGAPNVNTGEAFLVPYDCDPNFVNPDNAYRLKDLFFDLANLKARHLTVVLDACFSGYAGDGSMLLRNASPVEIKVQNPLLQHPNVTFFASSKMDQVSNWYPEKRHGMFTYFFLRGLRGKADKNHDRKITVEELAEFLRDEREGVPYWSNRLFQRIQEPVIYSTDPGRVLVDYRIFSNK